MERMHQEWQRKQQHENCHKVEKIKFDMNSYTEQISKDLAASVHFLDLFFTNPILTHVLRNVLMKMLLSKKRLF